MKISIARPAATENLTTVYDIDIPSLLTPLGLTNGQVPACNERGAYNADFSKVVLTAQTASESHAVVIDLAADRAIDLTAAREGSGFSAGQPLNETGVAFYSPKGPLRLTDRVVVTQGDRTLLFNLRNPSVATTTSEDLSRLESASGNDYASDPAMQHSRSILSPDGRFILNAGAAVPSYITAADDNGKDQAGVHEIQYQCGGFPQGWRDSHTAVLAAGDSSNQFYLVPVSNAGIPGGCIPLLPNSNRAISAARLRLDGKALFITVTGTRGDEYYRVDLEHPGTEPAQEQPTLQVDPEWRIFFPSSS